MDDAERAARIAELEHEAVSLRLECQQLSDTLHEKRTRLIAVELHVTKLRTEQQNEP